MFPHAKYGDKSVMWKNVETNLSCVEIFPHERCGDKSDLSQFMLFCRKICFVAIYAVLSQNLFGCDLRAFAWRRSWTKNSVCGEKRTNMRYAQTLCVRYCSLSNMTPTLCVNWSIMTPTPVCHQQVSSLPLSPNHCTPSAESRCVNEHLPHDEQHLPGDERHLLSDEQLSHERLPRDEELAQNLARCQMNHHSLFINSQRRQ